MRGFAVNHVVATGNRTPSAGDKVIIDAWIAGQARNDSCEGAVTESIQRNRLTSLISAAPSHSC